MKRAPLGEWRNCCFAVIRRCNSPWTALSVKAAKLRGYGEWAPLKSTTHIIGLFHLALKIRPIRQIANHIVGSRTTHRRTLVVIDKEIKALKWKLRHVRLNT